MNILITGANGYIGSHLAISLYKEHNLILLDDLSESKTSCWKSLSSLLPESILLNIDINDMSLLYENLKNHRIDLIIHLAAKKDPIESIRDPLTYYYQNINSTINILKCCRLKGIKKIIFASSAAVYGNNVESLLTENTDPIPINPYGNSKLMCEKIIQDEVQSEAFELSAYILRYFNPVGINAELTNKLNIDKPKNLAEHILYAISNNNYSINVFGAELDTYDGSCIRDYIHISDLVDAHISCITSLFKKKNDFQVFNIGSGNGVSVIEMIDSFSKLSELKLEKIIRSPRAGDPIKSISSIDKINKFTNWLPSKDLDDMVKDSLLAIN